jgi:DnaJ-domain-containing protein 1
MTSKAATPKATTPKIASATSSEHGRASWSYANAQQGSAKSTTKQSPSTRAKAKARKKDDDSDGKDDDILFAHSTYRPSQLTSRVRKAIRQFPSYSGELPPPEAEEVWSEQELYAFFFSNGFIRPKRKKTKTKVLPQPLLEQYCRVLGVPAGTDLNTIRRHYRKLALKYHPDKNSSQQDAGRFQEIGEAYEAITQHFQELQQS